MLAIAECLTGACRPHERNNARFRTSSAGHIRSGRFELCALQTLRSGRKYNYLDLIGAKSETLHMMNTAEIKTGLRVTLQSLRRKS